MNAETLGGPERMFELIDSLPEQLRLGGRLPGVEAASRLAAGLNEILVCGMGGSAIAADLIAPLLASGRLLPRREYGLPAWLPPGTLVVLSSYSGETEEVLAAAEAARERGLNHVVVSSGGSLPAASPGVPWIEVPGGLPPRASLGYGLGVLLELCRRMDLLRPDLAEIDEAADTLEMRRAALGPSAGRESSALTLAEALAGRLTIVHTTSPENHAVGRRWRAQIQENAKQPAASTEYPELDHNEIESWTVTVAPPPSLVVLRGGDEHARIARRVDATTALLAPAFASVNQVAAVGADPLTRILGQVQFGDYVSCHLAACTGTDPMPVPTITRLKSRLQQEDRS